MKKILNPALIWLKHILILCLIGFFIRLLFYLVLAPSDLSFSNYSSELIYAFIHGLRFDLSAISYFSLLFLLFTLFSKTPALIYLGGLNIYRLFMFFWIIISIGDILFYSFYTDRINLIAFGLFDDDTVGLLKIFWKNYPVFKVVGITALLCAVAYWSSKRFTSQSSLILNTSWKLKVFLFILFFMLGRGTLSMFPLGPDYAVISSIPFINQMSFGTAHALFRAAKLRSIQQRLGSAAWDANLKEFGYHTDDPQAEDRAFEDYFDNKIQTSRYDLMKFKTQSHQELSDISNVVLFMMESWGTYGITASAESTAFDVMGKMTEHFKSDYINLNFLANTPGTAGSLSCILGGVPQRAISPFLTESSYLSTQLSTSPALIYKNQGYETYFIYGGNPGWRDINKYAIIQGYDFIEGEIEVKKALDENKVFSAGKHDWGIYDEDLFSYIKLKISQNTNKKKLFVVMTTSNHPPFELPENYDLNSIKESTSASNFPDKNRLIDAKLAEYRFRTFRYSSDKLADFITELRTHPTYKNNTVLAATGDHSSWLVNSNANERLTKDSVPFYLFIPEKIARAKKLNKDVFKSAYGSHMDIWPTLYNLTLSHAEYESFGHDMFAARKLTFALDSARLIANKEAAVFVHNGGQSSYFIKVPQNRNGFVLDNLYDTAPEKTKTHELLEVKYRSLMGALDSYLNYSAKKEQN